MSRNPALRQGAERMAVNTPIQGTAADLDQDRHDPGRPGHRAQAGWTRGCSCRCTTSWCWRPRSETSRRSTRSCVARWARPRSWPCRSRSRSDTVTAGRRRIEDTLGQACGRNRRRTRPRARVQLPVPRARLHLKHRLQPGGRRGGWCLRGCRGVQRFALTPARDIPSPVAWTPLGTRSLPPCAGSPAGSGSWWERWGRRSSPAGRSVSDRSPRSAWARSRSGPGSRPASSRAARRSRSSRRRAWPGWREAPDACWPPYPPFSP